MGRAGSPAVCPAGHLHSSLAGTARSEHPLCGADSSGRTEGRLRLRPWKPGAIWGWKVKERGSPGKHLSRAHRPLSGHDSCNVHRCPGRARWACVCSPCHSPGDRKMLEGWEYGERQWRNGQETLRRKVDEEVTDPGSPDRKLRGTRVGRYTLPLLLLSPGLCSPAQPHPC